MGQRSKLIKEAAGSYLAKSLQPGEIILRVGRMNGAFMIAPTIFTLVAIIAMAYLVFALDLTALGPVAWITLVLPLTYFLQRFILFSTSEAALTNRRVLVKKGGIATSISEVLLMQVESVTIEQSFFGKIFSFGTLKVRGTGGAVVDAPALVDFMGFRAAIQNASNRN
jgi:uncharacterized membrane protein YdbT with pleckstrin-like domain